SPPPPRWKRCRAKRDGGGARSVVKFEPNWAHSSPPAGLTSSVSPLRVLTAPPSRGSGCRSRPASFVAMMRSQGRTTHAENHRRRTDVAVWRDAGAGGADRGPDNRVQVRRLGDAVLEPGDPP